MVLVVGLRLGCINHALLSAAAIRADGCRLRGWIGNAIDPAQPLQRENIATLRERLDVECLGLLGYHAPDPTGALATAAAQLRARS